MTVDLNIDIEIIIASSLYVVEIIGLLLYPVLKKAHLLINSALTTALATGP